ncbi:hypothetical protein BaRGS_00000695, partial [Batillaria attramentaria]
DAEYLGSDYLGLSNAISYDVWKVVRAGGMSVNMTIAVSTDGCVPLLQAQVGTNPVTNEKVDNVYMWSTFVANITDPTVFNIPASCLDASAVGK